MTVVDNHPDRVARRYDLTPLSGKTWSLDKETGFLHADVDITWTGVRTYRHADGSITRELRRPENTLDSSSLSSYGRLPVTHGHPSEFVSTKNIKDLQVGHIGDSIHPSQVRGYSTARGRITITDEKIAGLILGGLNDVSMGYAVKLQKPPTHELVLDDRGSPTGVGIWMGPHGPEEYDLEHHHTKANHVAAAFGQGRGGAQSRISLDENDALMMERRDHETAEVRKTPYILMRNDGFEVHQGGTGALLGSFKTYQEAKQSLHAVVHGDASSHQSVPLNKKRNTRNIMEPHETVQHVISVGDGTSNLKIKNYLFEGVPSQMATVVDEYMAGASKQVTDTAIECKKYQSKVDELQAKADEYERQIADLSQKLEEANSKTNLPPSPEAIAARLSLLDDVRTVMGVSKLEDSMLAESEDKLRSMAVSKVLDQDISGQSPEYIKGRFDALLMVARVSKQKPSSHSDAFRDVSKRLPANGSIGDRKFSDIQLKIDQLTGHGGA